MNESERNNATGVRIRLLRFRSPSTELLEIELLLTLKLCTYTKLNCLKFN